MYIRVKRLPSAMSEVCLLCDRPFPRLKASDADTRNAEQTLRVLESNLAMFEEHRSWLEQ